MTQYQQQDWPRDTKNFIEGPGLSFQKKSFFLSISYTLKFGGEKCSWLIRITEIDSSSVDLLIHDHEPCASSYVSCALWDSDPRAVCSLVGEMKIHRRANTTDLGITAHWRTHQKHCFTTERSTRAEIIRDWAGFLELKDILCSGPLGRKGKDIFGQRISISQDEKLDPGVGGLVSGPVTSSVGWELRYLQVKYGEGGLMVFRAEKSSVENGELLKV